MQEQEYEYDLSRREFLKRSAGFGALVLAGSLGGVSLAGCGSEKASVDLGAHILQTNWINNGSYVAEYLAQERGYYKKAGFSEVKLLFAGYNGPGAADLLSGGANMAYAGSSAFATAVSNGKSLICIGAGFQKNPFCVISKPDKPIRLPEDLIGKTIGVQNYNTGMFQAFLKINNIDPKSVTIVPAGTEPEPLAKGEIDGMLAFATVQPITLRIQHVEHIVMLLADHGFALFDSLWVVTRDELQNNRERAKAGLRVGLLAHQLIRDEKNLNEAVRLSIEKYAKDAGEDTNFLRQEWLEIDDLSATAVTRSKGLGYMDSRDLDLNIETLSLLGLKITKDAYTTELLDEIYADGITLKP